MLEGNCCRCGKADHKSPPTCRLTACRLTDKVPREDWAIDKGNANDTKINHMVI